MKALKIAAGFKTFNFSIVPGNKPLNEEKFIREFSEATIKDWKGLKLKYLEDLLLVDLGTNKPDTLLPYDADQAEILVQNSSEFDTWVNEVVFDLANFRRGAERTAVVEA